MSSRRRRRRPVTHRPVVRLLDTLDRMLWVLERPLRDPRRRPLVGVTLSVLATCAVLVGLVLVTVHPGAAQANGPDPLSVSVLLSDRGQGAALSAEPDLELAASPAPAAGVPVITVQDTQRDQRITGFGAALTDSSAELIEDKLSASARSALMSSLFGSSGIGLTWLRVPVGASDYTAGGRPYTYDDGPADPTLKRFSIARDHADVLPLLRQVRALDPAVRLLATPWTAPRWMKANHAFDNLGHHGTLLPADLSVYANYLVHFLQAYARAGVPVDALTPANEPTNPTSYPGMELPPATEATLVTRYLEPALARAHLTVGLYGADLGWASTGYVRTLAASLAAHGGLTGLAWHCYYGGPEVMAALHYEHPQFAETLSECSPGISTEPIAEIVIAALRNWATGVDLWNIALDPKGGPVQQPNTGCAGCSGLITINPATGTVNDNNPFFQLGQAARVLEPGAVRINSNSFVGYHYLQPNVAWASSGIDDVAAQNPDGSIALLAYNTATKPQTFAVRWHTYSFTYTLSPGATVSFRWRRPTESTDSPTGTTTDAATDATTRGVTSTGTGTGTGTAPAAGVRTHP